MLDLSIKNQIDPLLKKLASKKSLDVAEEIISVILNLIGIKCEKRQLLNIPRIDAELPRFELAPEFARQAAAFKIPIDKSNIFDINFFWIKKISQSNLSWLVGITPNFEDSEVNNYKNIGIDFVIPSECDRIIILLSNRYKVRSLELKDKIYPTQNEIFLSWINTKINEKEDIQKIRHFIHSQLWDSFNFEPINNKFYLELVEHFSILVNHLKKKFGKKPSVMFTTRLIGRILFIWFLNKKELINQNINYFEVDNPLDQISYYRNKFEVLIFDTLNKEISDRQNKDKITPYLNGGLFDISETDFYNNKELTFPPGFFNQLYETLNKYNFTVDESSPNFQQVAVDPEMLGSIFESLLTEQIDEDSGKSKRDESGAVYTPREIVSYMCEETIIEYLKEKIPYKQDRDRRIEELVRLPETIFRDQDQNKRRDWKPYNAEILKVLKGDNQNPPIRILDPAVGSGAFPIGMLNLLVKIYSRLDSKYEKNISQLKREILFNSLYGVDIEQIAIEICRLRAWLSIIVDITDKDQIEPLPNLDFKFTCANTLVSLRDNKQSTLFDDINLKEKLISIRDEYFNTTKKNRKIKLQKEYEQLTNSEDLFDSDNTRLLKSYRPFDVGSSSLFYDPEIHHGVKIFDIIVGNPPYIRQQNLKEFKSFLKSNFEIFNSKADLLTYFIEQSYNFLKDRGILSFIISNKFTRADYGKNTRKFLTTKTKILSFIDFGDTEIFKSVTTMTAILSFRKNISEKDEKFKYFNFNLLTNKKKPLDLVFKTDLYECDIKDLSEDSWTFEPKSKLKIKKKFSQNGIELKKWDIRIYGGVVTGLNKAFVINQEQKDSLILEHPSSEKLLKPLIRGRDIKRYKINYMKKWIIGTFPSLELNIDKYPAIKKHLEKFYKELQQAGDKGTRTKTTGKWFETHDSLSNWKDFEKPKIIYPYMTKYMPFYLDENNYYYTNQKCFILTGKYIYYLTCLFNSKLFYYCFRENFPILLGGTRELSKVFFEKIPVKKVSDKQDIFFKDILTKIQMLASKEKSYLELESKIDLFLYKFYELSFEEILTVDPKFTSTNEEYLNYQLPV
jgi:hypothetical protein